MNMEILTMVEMNKKTEALPVRQNTHDMETGEEQLSALIKEANVEQRRNPTLAVARVPDLPGYFSDT